MTTPAITIGGGDARRDEAFELCKRACHGDLSGRMTLLDMDDPDTPFYLALNDLLDLVEASLRESLAALDASNEGRYHRVFLEQGMPGTFRQAASSINSSLVKMDHRNQLAVNLRGDIQAMSVTLAGAATQLDATSTTLSKTAEDTTSKVKDGEKASDTVVANIQSVASAAEELSASVSEIAKQAEKSAESTRSATSESQAASQVMQMLAEAAEGVGGIVAVISDVARQTNLLALNAAIEAARAGDAGRGFGVVASEVKQLAHQTAKSTQDIDDRIRAMRGATEKGVQSISRIGGALEAAEGFASAISAAIYEQETATQHIARNAEEASLEARKLAGDLQEISQYASASLTSVKGIQSTAAEINHQAERLINDVESFTDKMDSGAP